MLSLPRVWGHGGVGSTRATASALRARCIANAPSPLLARDRASREHLHWEYWHNAVASVEHLKVNSG